MKLSRNSLKMSEKKVKDAEAAVKAGSYTTVEDLEKEVDTRY
mgnify:CR=1 FL=1